MAAPRPPPRFFPAPAGAVFDRDGFTFRGGDRGLGFYEDATAADGQAAMDELDGGAGGGADAAARALACARANRGFCADAFVQSAQQHEASYVRLHAIARQTFRGAFFTHRHPHWTLSSSDQISAPL